MLVLRTKWMYVLNEWSLSALNNLPHDENHGLITTLQEEFVSVSSQLKLVNISMGFDPKQWENHLWIYKHRTFMTLIQFFNFKITIYDLQSWTKYLRLALVFLWNRTLVEKFKFSRVFLLLLTKFSFWWGRLSTRL